MKAASRNHGIWESMWTYRIVNDMDCFSVFGIKFMEIRANWQGLSSGDFFFVRQKQLLGSSYIMDNRVSVNICWLLILTTFIYTWSHKKFSEKYTVCWWHNIFLEFFYSKIIQRIVITWKKRRKLYVIGPFICQEAYYY